MAKVKPFGSGCLPEMPPGTLAYVTEPMSGWQRPARAARQCVRRWCQVLGMPTGVVEDLDLAVSELVANAEAYGDGPVWLRLAMVEHGSALALDVYDAAPITRQLRDALTDTDADDPSSVDVDAILGALGTRGRGLVLVRAVARRVELLPHRRVGKTVRVIVAAPDPAPDGEDEGAR